MWFRRMVRWFRFRIIRFRRVTRRETIVVAFQLISGQDDDCPQAEATSQRTARSHVPVALQCGSETRLTQDDRMKYPHSRCTNALIVY